MGGLPTYDELFTNGAILVLKLHSRVLLQTRVNFSDSFPAASVSAVSRSQVLHLLSCPGSPRFYRSQVKSVHSRGSYWTIILSLRSR